MGQATGCHADHKDVAMKRLAIVEPEMNLREYIPHLPLPTQAQLGTSGYHGSLTKSRDSSESIFCGVFMESRGVSSENYHHHLGSDVPNTERKII